MKIDAVLSIYEQLASRLRLLCSMRLLGVAADQLLCVLNRSDQHDYCRSDDAGEEERLKKAHGEDRKPHGTSVVLIVSERKLFTARLLKDDPALQHAIPALNARVVDSDSHTDL
jgi:hypothetical protein